MVGPRLPLWLMAAVLVLMTVLAYQPVWHAGFIWDDDAFLVDNPLIKAGDGLYRFWCTTSAPDYFPMTSTTLWLEWRLWGDHPLGYHLVNVLLHAASSVLLWRVLARLNIPGAWLAAAIFALHPVNVESVAWITERKNTLAMFFCAWTLLWYVRFDQQSKAGTVPPGPRHPSPVTRHPSLFYWLSLGAFALALLSKTAVVTLPVVLLLLVWWRRGWIDRRDVGRTIPFFAMAGLLGLLTVWFQYHRAIGSVIVRTDSFWARLAGAGWAIWFYLYKALWPLDLMFVYPRWSMDASKPLSYLPGLLVVVVLAVGWHYRRQWGRPVLFALGCFVVMLLPVLGFLNIYFMRYSLVADHWQYFAILGPIALLAAAWSAVWSADIPVGVAPSLAGADKNVGAPGRLWRASSHTGLALGGVVLLVLGVLTWKQARLYADSTTLWQDTLAKNPACWLANNNLGTILANQGQIDDAIGQYQQALRLEPGDACVHNNLGIALDKKGQTDGAIREYQEAVRLKPDYAEARYNLGVALDKQGQTDGAIRQYQEAVRLKPDYAEAHNNLGVALTRKGQTDDAICQYQEALRLKPDYAETHNNLGTALDAKGQTDAAIHQYRETIRLAPDHPMAHYNLANALDEKGQIDEAIRQYQEALRLKPDNADAHNNLGDALQRQGRSDEAIPHFEECLRLQPGHAFAHFNLANALQQRGRINEAIRAYQAGLKLKPDDAQAHSNLGAVFYRQGRNSEAIRQFQEALRLKPDYADARRSLDAALAGKAAAQ